MVLNKQESDKVRQRWSTEASFLGFPDAERDSEASNVWFDQLLTRPRWFDAAVSRRATLIVGRKGVGKSACRIAATGQHATTGDILVVSASADELAARHAIRLQSASERGFGAVADWTVVFAELVVRHIAVELAGTLITSEDDEAIRRWATIEGIAERDFGERVVSTIAQMVPWAKKLLQQRDGLTDVADERFRRIASARAFALYIDDFDNLQENRSLASLRLIRDAVEAADRITHQNRDAEIHLMMRQDLWLRLRPGWHYADKVAGLVQLNWSQDDLRKWADRRLRYAVAEALEIAPDQLGRFEFGELWRIFFPEDMVLRNEKESSGLHYLVRRTMYTPRGLRHFMELILRRARGFPADARAVEDAEREFSVDQLEFLKTEFGGLCEGLDICLQSFTGKKMQIGATELYKHLKGLIGNGQVRLLNGASGRGETNEFGDAVSLARFLFRIGFLEVRYQQTDRFEVRDAMRHPEHWKSIRKDDAVKWAVRSAFYFALQSR